VTTIRTRRWPWFALSAVLWVLALVAFRGAAAGVVAFAALATFLGACLRGLAMDAAEDPERLEHLHRAGMIGL